MVLIVLPDRDFDPTETSVPWHYLKEAGYDVRFATPSGEPGEADSRLIEKGFSVLSPIFMTRPEVVELYREMAAGEHYQNPLVYEAVREADFKAILIPGGHAQGMKLMLESEIMQRRIVEFFAANKPVGAICHGVLLLARSIDPQTGKSVLYGRKTTALPKKYEWPAWRVTSPWLDDYYRTYPVAVEDEVKASLADEDDFLGGPLIHIRDTEEHPERGFIVRDGNYLSARYPGDCYRFGESFVELIDEQ
ncbi:MAG: type 1 glutamine amidotransferase domain-containing protein [Candidatus Promineifilaceae bacterium]|jgi:putative intracellular protease/amidase